MKPYYIVFSYHDDPLCIERECIIDALDVSDAIDKCCSKFPVFIDILCVREFEYFYDFDDESIIDALVACLD